MDEITGEYRKYIDQILEKWLSNFENEPQKILYDAMQYSLLAGGKRLRPILTLEFCRLCGGEWKKAAHFGAAVEMIHTYSLIHDDLPAMDNDDYRRGRLTNHKVYGEALAILAGDALQTDAFSCVTSADLPGEAICRAVSVLAEQAGSRGMVGGQVLDILSEERELTEQEVLDIQSRKTGGLIRAACALGVIAGGGSPEQLDAADRFASCLGLAFQIRDDMLDVIGTQQEMGKGVGTDDGKNTFVRLYGLERCEELVQEYTQKAVEALQVFDDTEYIVAISNTLTQRKV
ncbi:MAG: polyprenyl synthetase family protein [Ruminococcaceae bacterium]|nr:polyprenyl synthetase family protein [Oscillospiraceae bacterium]